jgi:hypothetical protein
MAVFWVVSPFRLTDVYRRFRGAAVFVIIAMSKAVSNCEMSVNLYQTAQRKNLKRRPSSYSRRENLETQFNSFNNFYLLPLILNFAEIRRVISLLNIQTAGQRRYRSMVTSVRELTAETYKKAKLPKCITRSAIFICLFEYETCAGTRIGFQPCVNV